MPAGNREKTVSWVAVAAVLLLGPPFLGCNSRPQPARPETNVQSAEPATNTTGRILRVRSPAVAGLFYPADEATLSRMVDGLLAGAPSHAIPRLKALVCPHAGYPYSGPTAAIAYKNLAGRGIQTVVILGSSHYAAFAGASVPDVDAYETPLGTVPISAKAQTLAQTAPFILEPKYRVERPSWARQSSKPAPALGEDTPDTWEHSVEVQVPFLQRVLTNFSILPVVFGEVDPELAARALAGVMDDRTVIVTSSDLSHYHPYDEARALDTRCVKAICNLDINGMKTEEACGKLPILTLIYLARLKGWKAQLLDYRNSGDTAGDKSGVVGYAAIAFYEPAPESYAAPERKILLDLARRTLTCAATNPELSGFEVNGKDLPSRLAETRACFVTLTERGELRGCIGHILPQEPLYRAVVANARNAATRDPRFLPVQPGEADKIKIEISVLTEPEPLQFSSPEDLLSKLKPDEDGVLLQIGARGATFLPQVWEQLPDKVEFLNHLAQKAGCAPNDWRGRNVNVSLYHVEAFKEAE
jgi:AmmeMemoRadiSam system protein B/AmmeMemoRadiSam system protein A